VDGEIHAGTPFADVNKLAQRAIFQLLDLHVTLDHINKKRWANVTFTLAQRRCIVKYGMPGYTMKE
jgi:hypothetical protein